VKHQTGQHTRASPEPGPGCRGDTHNRHQQAWTSAYSGGRWERSMPGSGRCWTSWPCFASRGSLGPSARRADWRRGRAPARMGTARVRWFVVSLGLLDPRSRKPKWSQDRPDTYQQLAPAGAARGLPDSAAPDAWLWRADPALEL